MPGLFVNSRSPSHHERGTFLSRLRIRAVHPPNPDECSGYCALTLLSTCERLGPPLLPISASNVPGGFHYEDIDRWRAPQLIQISSKLEVARRARAGTALLP